METRKRLLKVILFPCLLVLLTAGAILFASLFALGIFASVCGILIGVRIFSGYILTSVILLGYSSVIIGICAVAAVYAVKLCVYAYPAIIKGIGKAVRK